MLKKEKKEKKLHIAKFASTLGKSLRQCSKTTTHQLRSTVINNEVYLEATLGNRGVQNLHLQARPHGD